MKATLATSYRHCRRVAWRSASTFCFSFLLLPRPKRAAMWALYAFLRRTDDLSDSSEPCATRRALLAQWRSSLDRALAGSYDDPVLPALVDTVKRFELPIDRLHAVIDGVEMDLEQNRYETFADLEIYCRRVASAVGRCCIAIWGFRGPAAFEPAEQCGLAFQFTNILRDLKEDAARDRVYLPQEDLRQFGYTSDDLLRGVRDERFAALMQFEIERTEAFYRRAAELDRWLSPDGRRIYRGMTAAYRAILEEIKRLGGDVLRARARLSGWRKFRIAARSLFARGPVAAPTLGALSQ